MHKITYSIVLGAILVIGILTANYYLQDSYAAGPPKQLILTVYVNSVPTSGITCTIIGNTGVAVVDTTNNRGIIRAHLTPTDTVASVGCNFNGIDIQNTVPLPVHRNFFSVFF